MKIFLILFLIIFNKFILLSETNITNFLLVTDNEDRYGFVSNEEFENVAGIHSFKKNKDNFYDFEKTVQKFNVKLNLIDSLSVTVFSNSDVIIVSDADYPDEEIEYLDIQKIINLKNPEKIHLLNISQYLCLTSFFKENSDLLLIQQEIIVNKEPRDKILTYDERIEKLKKRKLEYHFFNSITGEKKVIEKEIWIDNLINTFPTCYIKNNLLYMWTFWDEKKLFPFPENQLLNAIFKKSIEKQFKFFSYGLNLYYFISLETDVPYIYFYDIKNRTWNYVKLAEKVNQSYKHEDYLAMKHIYPELKEQRINNGWWTFLRDGEIIDRVNLGISSKVLAFDENGIIFSNDCRLYSAKISRKGLYDVKKIAEHNLIRFAKKLYFPKKENTKSNRDE